MRTISRRCSTFTHRIREYASRHVRLSCGMTPSAVQPDAPHAPLSVATGAVRRPSRKASSRITVISPTVRLKITGLVHLLNIVIIHVSCGRRSAKCPTQRRRLNSDTALTTSRHISQTKSPRYVPAQQQLLALHTSLNVSQQMSCHFRG